jgi:hypothetical protein
MIIVITRPEMTWHNPPQHEVGQREEEGSIHDNEDELFY